MNKKRVLDKKQVTRMYEKHFPMYIICRLLNTSYSTLKRHFDMWGIKPRPKQQEMQKTISNYFKRKNGSNR
ncbi:MAG TPA: hypothetical protein ENI23_15170 [bacterium]|nr:hypothetical protein [bacterium]